MPSSVELFSVPECPNLGRVRNELRHVLADLNVTRDVIERVGDYPSPSVVVDGLDVVTRQRLEPGAACRLDLPTRDQLRRALLG